MRMQNNVNLKERDHQVTWDFTLKNNPKYIVKQAKNMRCREGVLQSGTLYEWVLSDVDEKRSISVEDLLAVVEIPYYDQNTHSYKARYGGVTSGGSFLFQKKGALTFEAVAEGIERPAIVYYTAPDQTIWTVMVGGKAICINGNGVLRTFPQTNLLSCACFYKHRLFLAEEQNVLLYSAPEDFMNFEQSLEGGGEISFPNAGGNIIGLKAFQEALYVFFDRGILRVEIKGNPKDFAAESIEYSGGSIFARTICVCGEGILFMASDGVYRLHGKKAERLFADFIQLPVRETKEEACAGLSDRAFIRYETSAGKRTLVLASDGKDCYYADDLTALSYVERANALFVDEEYLICRLTDAGKQARKGVFKTETDFGVSGYKTLRKLRFEGEGAFILTVEADKRKRMRKVTLEDGFAEVELSERGKTFKISFSASDKLTLRKLSAELKTVT